MKHENPRVQSQATRFVNDKTIEATKKYFDFVASTIIGARKVEQLDESFAAFKFKIDDELLLKIEKIQKDILYPMG